MKFIAIYRNLNRFGKLEVFTDTVNLLEAQNILTLCAEHPDSMQLISIVPAN